MAGRIRDSDIVEVRERTRIEEVVGEYVALRRAGAGALKGLCPFHDEKTPSFNVRPTHGTFHCFGCGEGGSVIDFVMKIEVVGFVEAVERLAERAGVRLTYEGGGSSVQRDRGTRSRLLEANRRAAEFYAAQLRTPEGAPALQFLTSRGFDAGAAAHFGCGYAPPGWDALTKHLLGAGFTLEELMKAGLSKEGRRGPIDRFHRRLLWPIRDLGGDVVGFGARRLFDDDPIEAKYLNTSDTPVYRKTQALFGLDLAKREIAKRRQVVVVEGYTDVMAMHLAGVPTAVAACGTAFGSDHVTVIRRLIGDDSFDLGEVIYTFDGDAAGQAAALKAFEGDQAFAAQTFVAIAPDGLDPCELRQRSGDTTVRDLVARREPLFEFAIRSMLREHDLDTPEGQTAALRRTVPLVARIRREDLRDEYARRLAGWTGWSDEFTVVRRVRETAGVPVERERGRPRREAPAPPRKDDPRLHLQREALKAALQVPAIAGPSYDELPEQAFGHPAFAAVHRAIQAAGGVCGGLQGQAWLEALAAHCTPEVRPLLTALAVEPLELQQRNPDEARYVASVVAGVRLVLVEAQVAELKSRLQRTNPLEEAEAYHQLFGDLVPLEQYRIALREKAAPVSLLRRLFTRDELPEGATGPLAADERVLASAALPAGGHLVATSAGLWVPTPDDGPRRIGWHLVSKASWGGGGLVLVEAQEREIVEGAVLLADLPARRLRLGDPGRLPEVVHQRVTGSIRSRHRRELPGGGAWFVQRKVPGHDGTLLQVRPDPGTDPAALRQVVADVARRVRAGP